MCYHLMDASGSVRPILAERDSHKPLSNYQIALTSISSDPYSIFPIIPYSLNPIPPMSKGNILRVLIPVFSWIITSLACAYKYYNLISTYRV